MPKLILYLILSEILLALFYNILKPGFPKVPGDIYINRSGFRIYIPFVSALVVSIALYLFLGQIIH